MAARAAKAKRAGDRKRTKAARSTAGKKKAAKKKAAKKKAAKKKAAKKKAAKKKAGKKKAAKKKAAKKKAARLRKPTAAEVAESTRALRRLVRQLMRVEAGDESGVDDVDAWLEQVEPLVRRHSEVLRRAGQPPALRDRFLGPARTDQISVEVDTERRLQIGGRTLARWEALVAEGYFDASLFRGGCDTTMQIQGDGPLPWDAYEWLGIDPECVEGFEDLFWEALEDDDDDDDEGDPAPTQAGGAAGGGT